MPVEPKDLVVFGNLVLDDVVYADGSTRMGVAGGAVLYLPLAASLWGLSVGVVSPLGNDYPSSAIAALESRGVDLAGLTPMAGPGLRTWLLYEGGRRRVVHRLDSATHEEASPTAEDLPPHWTARCYHLAPIPLGMQSDLAGSLARRGKALVSLDPFELVAPGAMDRWRRLARSVDLLLFSEDELDDPQARADPEPFLRRLARAGDDAGRRPRWVVYKQGADGGRVWEPGTDSFSSWPGKATSVVDPTGAGDAFAAGLLAGLLRGEPLERSLSMAVVSASFALEAHGPDGLLAATPESAEARLEEWFG